MSNSLDNIVIYNGYPLSIIVAVSFHCVVLAVLLYMQSNNRTEALELVQPTVIKALFIDENPQVVNAQNVERQRLERIEQQRVSRERQQAEAAAEAKRQADAEAQRQAEADAARQAEAARQRQQAALVERQKAEELRQEQERRTEAERQRQRELAEAERVRQQQAAERQRQQETADAAQAEAARTEFELVQSAIGLIQQVVQENWSRPPSARNGMRAILQIRMLPTGELVEATISQSSGDPAFDRSAESAVYRAAPFRELASLPISVFNANFRTLSLIFEPEDLLN